MPRFDLSLKLEVMANVRFQVSGFATRWRAVSLRSNKSKICERLKFNRWRLCCCIQINPRK